MFFLSDHYTISRLRPCQKMQRHRESLLCEWRRLLLLPWYKSAFLQVSNVLYSFLFKYFSSWPLLFDRCFVPQSKLEPLLRHLDFDNHLQLSNYKFLPCCLFLWYSSIPLPSFSSSSSDTSQEYAASLSNYPPVVYFNTNNGVRRWCAHPFKSCLVYRRAAH